MKDKGWSWTTYNRYIAHNDSTCAGDDPGSGGNAPSA